LSADGEVMVFHDATLDRMTEGQGKLADKTRQELQQLYLQGTAERIPTLKEVLGVVQGKVPLLIELKGESANTALCPAVEKVMEGYAGNYLVESFNPLLLQWYKRNQPKLYRGQLTTNLCREMGFSVRNLILDGLFTNVLSRPDFIAYDLRYRKRLSVWICTELLHGEKILWTVRNVEECKLARGMGAEMIFENCVPSVTRETIE